MGVAAVIAAVASSGANAEGGSGGVTTPGACEDVNFGERALRLGDCGDDVKTLNWVLKSKTFAASVGLDKEFDDPTDSAVREFQDRSGLSASGVVNPKTRRELKRSMSRKTATLYGPGFWRNETACGKTLRRSTIGVAHKRLPCGTKVTFSKGGRWLRTRVIDRGPYSNGASWDLTEKAATELGMEQTETVRSAVIGKK
jgi:rare lipoprotein A (peptidoglycan hydrolase)